MPSLYFTPASISYLNQFLLSLLITIYLSVRLVQRARESFQRQDHLLLMFFLWTTLFSLLLFLEASFLPAERFIVVCFQNTILAAMLVTLIQFAYHFPVVVEKQKLERRIVLWITIFYTLAEAGIAAWRLHILGEGRVEFRPALLDIPVALEFVWVIFVFVRSSIRNWNQPVIRQFALIFLIPLWLALLNILRSYYAISTSLYHINMSVGILFTIFPFALAYLVSLPEKTSFITKLSATVLTGILAVLGTISWLVAPAYAKQFDPSIIDHRTIRFTPNESGGYDAEEAPFHFEGFFGENLDLFDEIGNANRSIYETTFPFPFLGETYDRVFITNDGVISMGSQVIWRNYQYHFANAPMIIPLLVDLSPTTETENGVYLLRQTDRLVITYLDVPAYNHPEARYTFQVILFADGSFEFTYNGLPDLDFHVDDRPEATAWAIGYKPAHAPQTSTNFASLPQQGGAEGLLQDEYRNFRSYLHEFMLPVAAAIFVSGLIFLAGLPLVLHVNFTQPLNTLLHGVQEFNQGKRGATTPIYLNDEIGFLAAAFNNMTGELDTLISDLESRVKKRTAELVEVNRTLSDSQKFFEELFEASPDAVITINQQGVITQANARAEIVFGYARLELLGKPINTLFPENFADIYRKGRRDNRKASQVSAVGIEVYGKRKDGRVFPADLLFSPFKSTQGRLILAVVRDISERVDMENILRRRNETLAALDQMMLDLANRHEVDDILQALLGKIGPLLDAQDVSIDMAEGGDTLVTYAATPNQPLKTGDIMRRGEGGWLSWQAVDTRQPAVLEDYSTWERRRDLYEGHPIHAIVIVPILQGERVAGTINFSRTTPDYPFDETDIYAATQLAQMVALALDNSHLYTQLRTELEERREIEEVLRISQKNFMSYFNMGAVGMAVTTPDQQWLEVNDRLCEMMGYSREELRQIHWNELTHPDDLAANLELFEQAIRGERDSYQMDKRFVRKDGGIVYASMYATCQRNVDRSVGYFLVSLVDITERVQQEQALQQAQAELLEQRLNSATLEERQRLARDLHDSLNQSIHSLVLFSETLMAAIEKKNLEHAKHIVEQVQESARQSLKETRLLLFELQTQGQGRSVDLIRDLEERLAKVENHAGIRSQVSQKGNLKHIPLSWHENLYWITIEALNNALKHAQARKMFIDIRCTPKELELTITDDGRGFFPAKVVPGGMGLENMQVRAQQLGGQLTVESEPAKGTCVRFRAEIKAEDRGKY
ncbi:MAG: PAS domain S-box protein [Chloroflexota bacterium]